jgi:hypothetical protein
MAFSYCPHCGFKNMYSLQAPKFCGGCGEGLSILSAAKQKNTAPTKTPARKLKSRSLQEDESYDPEGSDVYEVPNISRLSYSIEQDKNKFSLKDIIPLDQLEDFDESEQSLTKKPKKRGRPKKS